MRKKQEKEKALKKVGQQLKEKETVAVPGIKEKTFEISKSEMNTLRGFAHTHDLMNQTIDIFSSTAELIRNYYAQWADDEISDKEFLNKTLLSVCRLSKERENVKSWAKHLSGIFDFLGWIEDGRPEKEEENDMPDDDIPF